MAVGWAGAGFLKGSACGASLGSLHASNREQLGVKSVVNESERLFSLLIDCVYIKTKRQGRKGHVPWG